MFLHIEEKLKGLAKAMAVFGILAAIAGAVCFYVASDDADLSLYIGICAGMIAGGFALFVGSFFAYGLGQLIENTAGNAPVASTAPSCTVAASTPSSASAPAAAPASADEATIVAVATAAIAASRGASACAFKVISITKIQ